MTGSPSRRPKGWSRTPIVSGNSHKSLQNEPHSTGERYPPIVPSHSHYPTSFEESRPMKRLGISTLIGCLLSLCSVLLNAKVVVEREMTPKKLVVLKIVDRILYEEDETLKAELDRLERDGYRLKLNSVVLNSRGGNGSAAQAMGKMIRERKLNTFLGAGSVCDSACIYVLSGGVVRMAFGTVSVHRTSYEETYPVEKLEEALKSADDKTRKHIYDMGLSYQLTDAILMTPNSSIRKLEEAEKLHWGVHGTERMYEEIWFRNTSRDTKYSVSVVESFFRKHISNCNEKARRFEMTAWECVRRAMN